ncbi:MAG: hypothetical protein ACKOAR_11535 [Bacteroidota bacterium]
MANAAPTGSARTAADGGRRRYAFQFAIQFAAQRRRGGQFTDPDRGENTPRW